MTETASRQCLQLSTRELLVSLHFVAQNQGLGVGRGVGLALLRDYAAYSFEEGSENEGFS
jgi:hypothetical protein